jgi:signal transduction histidine kinase
MSRDAFQQLFMNVFTNAIDSLESRDMKQVHIQVERQSGNVIIKIIDTGCGIPAEIREKIFDPFFTTKPPGKGTGLGLATCWKVVQSQGGHMGCRSRAGSGTEMVITLPTQRNVGDYH